MIVVGDTSVIINLAFVGEDAVLAALFGEVIVPTAVADEFRRLATSGGVFHGLNLPGFVRIQHPASIPHSLATRHDLDPGETEARALAVEIHADAILMDEATGRNVALLLGLTPIGVLGILVRAKQRGLVPAIAPIIGKLLTRASFRLAGDLVADALRLVGETP